VGRNPAAPVVADLRRGISTAYYALFHLLVNEATERLVTVVSLRPRVARSFDHKIMKSVCQDYVKLTSNPVGQVVPQAIKDIASEFVALQHARHQADYDTSAIITQAQADTDVMRAETAFLDWVAVQGAPATDTFLAELLCRGIPRR
jgi:hypothetical protein